MPGSQRSRDPWKTSRRFPAIGASSSRSGIQGASPITPSTRGSSAAEIATAPPIENPTSRTGPAVAAIAARQSSMHRSSTRHDLTR